MMLSRRNPLPAIHAYCRAGITCLLLLFLLISCSDIAMAANSIALKIPDSAAPGSTVHVTGSIGDNGPMAGIVLGITVQDAKGNNNYVNQTTSAADGSFSFDIGLPAAASGTWQVFVSGGGAMASTSVKVAAQEQQPSTSAPSSGGGTPTPAAVTSTTGSATVTPANGGTVSLGSDAKVSIPAGALQGSTAVNVSVQKVSSPPGAPSGFQLLGSVYEFTVDGKEGYSFVKPVTLTFSFDPTALPDGATPAIYYYDTASSQWVSLGGSVSGNTITVTVDHFTKFAVLAKQAAPAPVPAQVFSDVPVSYWASDAIAKLNGLGCINGYPDGAFRPGNQITRAEFVSIMGKVLKLPAYSPEAPDFKDVSSQDWYYGSVEGASHVGIIKGYGNVFRPSNPITREQMACILVNALGRQDEAKSSLSDKTVFTDDHSISDWARGFIAVAVKNSLIKGYPENNSFRPQHGATRAEACAMISNFLSVHK